jgi:hypothetical protein
MIPFGADQFVTETYYRTALKPPGRCAWHHLTRQSWACNGIVVTSQPNHSLSGGDLREAAATFNRSRPG